MCVRRVRDAEATRGSGGFVAVGDAGRIDDERTPVTEVDEVRGVPEALVDEADDRHYGFGHPASPL